MTPRSQKDAFDTRFELEGMERVDIPYRAPNANAFAERWIRSVREQCLKKLLILNERCLHPVLTKHLAWRHYQGLEQDSPDSTPLGPRGASALPEPTRRHYPRLLPLRRVGCMISESHGRKYPCLFKGM